MEESIYQLFKDFYTLKAEYQVNMQQIQQANQGLTREVDRLIASFNELRDSVAEHVDEKTE